MADNPFATPEAVTAPGTATRQPVEDDPSGWGGDGFPHLPDEFQNAMRELVLNYEQENQLARLNQVRTILRNREFYAGRQVSYWSAQENRWVVPTAQQLGVSEEDYTQAVELITNLIRPKIKIVMAELSQSPPRTAFSPLHAKEQADAKLAHEATSITGYINRENHIDEKLPYEIWLLCTDGSFAEYWRFVRDEKFGIEEYEVEEGDPVPVEIQSDRAVCPECKMPFPAESPEAAPMVCPECGAPMGPATFAPREIAMRQPKVTKQRPAGREVCDVIGALESVVPAYEKDEEELGFFTWAREVHKSKLMTIFPEAAGKIEAGGLAAVPSGTNERIARLSLLSGYQRYGDGLSNLITFRETWFRPWCYESLRQKQPDIVERLRAAFPDGFRVAFAGDTYCGAWAEKLQDHITVCHALPGDGQYRGALASDAIATQRKYNKCDSIQMDTLEGGLPFLIHDTDVLATGALNGRTQPNATYGARGSGNKSVQNSVFQSKPTEVSPQLVNYQNGSDRIMDSQFGTYAPMYGGETGGNDTAHGIAIERNAAKGVLGMTFRAIKNFRARADMKNIRRFLANRSQDVEISVAGPGSEFDSVNISLADLRDGNVQVEENADESYPVSLNEQREVVTTLVNNANPIIMPWFAEIPNAVQLVDLLGISELITVPGADSREKMYDIIQELLKGAPILPPPPIPPPMDMGEPMPPMLSSDNLQPGPQPVPMGPALPPPPEPSIQPDPVLDNLQVYLATCMEWAASSAGRKAMLETPDGYANVRAFAQKCLLLTAPPPMPLPGEPPPGGGPPGEKKPLPHPPEVGASGPLPAVGPGLGIQ